MKKTKIILILAFIILIILAFANSKKTFACGSDSECYELILQYDAKTWNHYINYYIDYNLKSEYINKNFKIIVPTSKSEFIYLEYLYNTNQLDKNNRYYKTIVLNMYLIKYGLEPLYY